MQYIIYARLMTRVLLANFPIELQASRFDCISYLCLLLYGKLYAVFSYFYYIQTYSASYLNDSLQSVFKNCKLCYSASYRDKSKQIVIEFYFFLYALLCYKHRKSAVYLDHVYE